MHTITKTVLDRFNVGYPFHSDRCRKEDGNYGPYFTGWKLDDLGYVGQFIFRFNRQERAKLGADIAYVNLPGMQTGFLCFGESFNIGTGRVPHASKDEFVEKLLIEGLVKLGAFLDVDFCACRPTVGLASD